MTTTPAPRSVSLRMSLARAIALVLIVTLLFGALLTYWHAETKVETEVGSAMAAAERTVRQAIKEIENADEPRLELLRLVRVFDGNRHVRTSLVEPEPANTRVSSSVAEAEEVPRWFLDVFSLPPRVVRLDLPANLSKFGWLELEADSRAEVAEVWDDVLLKLTILAVFCALVLSLVYLAIGRALAPLGNLQVAFERVGGGDYASRVEESGPTELVVLAHGFNDMAGRLGEMEGRTRQLQDQLATVQEEERADLARDLHDEVSPFLFSVDVDASNIRSLAETAKVPDIVTRTDAIAEAVAHMKKHVRSILGRLRPPVPLELGLADAIETLVASWQLRHPDVAFSAEVEPVSCGQRLDVVLHGIVREALSNALKHGQPRQIDVRISLSHDDKVAVVVEDDGTGLEPDSLSHGFGLVAMRERVAALGGEMTIANRKQARGVALEVSIPAPEVARTDGPNDERAGMGV